MNKIKLLSPQEAQKIAAGEVVERPASVCKELIENSLDAGATQITLEIKKAGKELISVIDNGCGMSPQDAITCFLPHATSKLSKVEELHTLTSFGFRGEALAVISAVGQVTLTTRLSGEHDSGIATRLEMIDGQVSSQVEVQAASGTSFTLKNLFYNVPARQKFLKQDETEWNQILSLFQAASLSHLSVHFKLYKDQNLFLNLPPASNLQDRVCQLFDYNFAQNMLELEVIDASLGLKITGLISNHQMWRYHRGNQFFFVNGRWVKNSELVKAVTKGYANILPEGRFPAFFIFITIDSKFVDVNVHPRKEEVKFVKPLVVANCLQEAIKTLLEQQVIPQKIKPLYHESVFQPGSLTVPQAIFESFDMPFPEVEPPQVMQKKSFELNIPLPKRESFPSLPELLAQELGVDQVLDSPLMNSFVPHVEVPVHKPLSEVTQQQKIITQQLSEYKIIGQMLNCYILIETADGLTMVDQHAMHERILYHKFLNKFECKEGTRLMFPLTLSFKEAEIRSVMAQVDFFATHGIEFEQFGTHAIRVLSLPPAISHCNIQELFQEVVQFMIEADENKVDANSAESFRKKLHEHFHGQMACKAAVKKGDQLTILQMEQIMQDAQSTPLNYICVHGRPTTWKISLHQLEKQFQRK